MERLSLRLRMGLFFLLIGAGSMLAVAAGLWVGFNRAAAGIGPAFVSAGLIAGIGIAALAALVWLLFDEHMAKPIDALAAQLRMAPHAAGGAAVPEARYLGDLAPAAAALQQAVHAAQAPGPGESNAEKLMLDILSELPVAVLVVNAAHRIVLYDGQACELLERAAPARVGGSIFDYFDDSALRAAFARISETGAQRLAVTLSGRSGEAYSGHLCRLGAQPGYTLMLEALDVEAERPLTFDVSLLDAELPESLAQTPLAELAFVVFDTETTGLDAVRDEVVQLAAVRVLRGQIIPGEEIDSLVNPGRAIPSVADARAPDHGRHGGGCAAFH